MAAFSLDYDRYRADANFRLADVDPADTQKLDEDQADDVFDDNRKELDDWQERLYAEDKQSLLVVLQAMDAAGKDSTIRKVFGDLNPQGCRVWGFKAPSKEELSHDFLWRIHDHAPQKGNIAVFNRSHYEDVLVVKVHGWASPDLIEKRYGHINAFEELLADHGTRILKIMLYVSKEFQLERFKNRLRKPDKHWKFNPGDLKERGYWDDYMDAYQTAIRRCSTPWAPWYVIPAEERWFRNLVVSQLVLDTLKDMNPQYPEPSFDPNDYPPDSIV